MIIEHKFFVVDDPEGLESKIVFSCAVEDEVRYIKTLMETYVLESFNENDGFSRSEIKKLLCPDAEDLNDSSEELIPEFILQGLIQNYATEDEANGKFKIETDIISRRMLYSALEHFGFMIKIKWKLQNLHNYISTYPGKSVFYQGCARRRAAP